MATLQGLETLLNREMQVSQYDDDDDDQIDEPTPGDLRKALAKANKELKAFREGETKRATETRETAIKAIIAEKGLSPKVAGMVPKDLATDALANWFTENAEAFGGSTAPVTPTEPDVKPDTSGLDSINTAQSQGGVASGGADDIIAAIKNTTSEEEWRAALFASGVKLV